MMQTV